MDTIDTKLDCLQRSTLIIPSSHPIILLFLPLLFPKMTLYVVQLPEIAQIRRQHCLLCTDLNTFQPHMVVFKQSLILVIPVLLNFSDQIQIFATVPMEYYLLVFHSVTLWKLNILKSSSLTERPIRTPESDFSSLRNFDVVRKKRVELVVEFCDSRRF